MYPIDREILKGILTLIEQDKYTLALKSWSAYRYKVAKTCVNCPYKGINLNDDCSMCLEGKLRTLSLYHHAPHGHDRNLLDAARKLEAFRNESRDIA